jgi:hypothetical protein
LICACGQSMPVADKGKLNTLCPCGKNLTATISNRLMGLIRDKSAEYYTNKFKCKCNRQYNLSPFFECCKIKYKPRSNIPFEIHELVYVAKDLLHIDPLTILK